MVKKDFFTLKKYCGCLIQKAANMLSYRKNQPKKFIKVDKKTIFKNSLGVEMDLQTIIAEEKKVISVTFTYLCNKRYVNVFRPVGFPLVFKKEVWGEKEVTIYSKNGMLLKAGQLLSISFSSKKEFEKIEKGYNINSLWKQDMLRLVPSNRYCIEFHQDNLIAIDWLDRKIF